MLRIVAGKARSDRVRWVRHPLYGDIPYDHPRGYDTGFNPPTRCPVRRRARQVARRLNRRLTELREAGVTAPE
jgi:hypothetical protein